MYIYLHLYICIYVQPPSRVAGEDPSVQSQTIYIPENEKRKNSQNQIIRNKDIVLNPNGKMLTPQKGKYICIYVNIVKYLNAYIRIYRLHTYM
jgi:hypothetical protein